MAETEIVNRNELLQIRRDKLTEIQNEGKNPFVFFALFCDNMQIWDRPFDVNQGRIDIIKPSIPHEDFLFGIYDNRVYIHCKSADMETVIKNYRKSLDEYLQEASKLIVLGISE